MYISITITAPEKSLDIQVDDLQYIDAVLNLLMDSVGMVIYNTDFLYSSILNRVVSAKSTFIEEGIRTGDELIILNVNQLKYQER